MRKKFKKWFRTLMRRELVVTVPPGEALHVLEINTTADTLTEGMGMSDERVQELSRLTMIAYDESDNTVTTLVKASKNCNHANELAFVAFIICRRQEQSQSSGNLIAALLRGGRK